MLRPSLAVLLVVLFASTLVVVTPASANAATRPSILINELANGGPGPQSDSFFELRNWSDSRVDLTGWEVYRCSGTGLRSNVGRTEALLDGVVLEPGEIFTARGTGMPGDAQLAKPFAALGFGLYLENPRGDRVDAVGVYPNQPWPTHSECTVGANLANRLNFATGESWQRVSATGNVAEDFIVARSTIREDNRTAPDRREASAVVISEAAPSGPAAVDDEFVELYNAGTRAEDISGWQLYRCTAKGRLTDDTLQWSAPLGTVLQPGARWVVGGPGFTGSADASYATHLADITFGLLLRTDEGNLADRMAVSSYPDSACQDGDEKLPAVLDFVAAESYQRSGNEFLIARRTPGGANETVGSSIFGEPFEYAGEPTVAISEIATDPSTAGMPFGSERRNFIELGNYGATPVDIGGWSVRRCEATGIRSRELQFSIPEGTVLAPGGTFLAAREGTSVAHDADIAFAVALNLLGTGVWLEDDRGERRDSVGIFQANEMDSSNITQSPCTKGLALTTYVPDRLLHETFQRSRFTGVDAEDFVTRRATPGRIDRVGWAEPTLPVAIATGLRATPSLAIPAPDVAPAGEPAAVIEAWSGHSDGPLETLSAASEIPLDGRSVDDSASTDDSWAFPYQRFVLGGLEPGSTITWTGTALARNELQLSVWHPAAESWRLLDAGTGAVQLTGQLLEGEVIDGTATVLVQDGRRSIATLAAEPDAALEKPAAYDFAISHITDTQYLSESYPDAYAEMVSWIAANAESRSIEFVTHSGDLVQNWVDPDQNDIRARVEFERASAIQQILDDAGIPNSVLPGNHDNKRGVDSSLFNEYFPPGRYDGNSWFGGSIGEDDNSANFSTFEYEGAKFLMISLPYAYGDEELAWAESIVATHSEYNVIVSTHEHLTPKTLEAAADRSSSSRWVSRGAELWDRVIAPNRNVVAVLAGHYHGIGEIRTENAGGIEGHSVVELLADYQEFRTHSGERATGFQRLLQIDLAAGAIAVDTFSVRLGESASFPYDYRQFVPDDGRADSLSNSRPWRIIEAGLQGRYTSSDDEFTAVASFQYPKAVDTDSITITPPVDSDPSAGRPVHRPHLVSQVGRV